MMQYTLILKFHIHGSAFKETQINITEMYILQVGFSDKVQQFKTTA